MIETRRLRLREVTRDDLGALAAMVADPEQMTFYPGVRTRDEAADWMELNLGLYAERGFGTWLVESRADAAFLGYSGIRPLVLDGREEMEIGWHIHKSAWGRGVTSEAAAAARDLAFDRFRFTRLVATIHPDHAASRGVAERIGMQIERRTVLEDDYPALVYVAVRPR